jgi:hypothetical protein
MISEIRSALLRTGTHNRTGHLANDKFPFRLVEIMCRNFEVELERMVNEQVQGNRQGRLTGAGPLRIRPAGGRESVEQRNYSPQTD